jgi:hypothetical protein
MYLIYKTDTWHSYASRNLIGCTIFPNVVIDICEQQAKKEGETIDTEQLFNLKTYMQTQGYTGEGEFHYEEIETDVLL